MSPLRWHAVLGMVTALVAAPAVRAQQPSPRIGYVYPAGGQQGSTFQVVIGGQKLTGLTNVYVSGHGVEVVLLERTRPLTPQEFREYLDLKAKVDALEQKKLHAPKPAKPASRDAKSPADASASREMMWTADDAKLLAESQKQLTVIMRKPSGAVRKPPTPALADLVTAQITVARDAEPGQREVRVIGPSGVSNPLAFFVGQVQEFSENASETITKPKSVIEKSRERPQTGNPKTEMTITLPATVNGQVLPGEVNRYRFTAKKGQRLVITVSARQLIPYLPDAVPGWFQAALSLHNAKGEELAYDDDFRFNPDPVLYYEIAAEGEYVIAIKDALYRGREDFVYRITLGELPFVTSIFPLGRRVGEPASVEMKGWNLESATLMLPVKNAAPGIQTVAARRSGFVSNRVPFALDTLPECFEAEPNNDITRAQKVAPPVVVNGCIDRTDDRDVFQFQGRAGDTIIAETYARRLDSPLDSVLKLTDAFGGHIALNDDYTDVGAGLTTHQADSYLRVTLPAGGTYYLHVGDTQHQGGPEYGYRLRLSAPQPDFALRLAPSSIAARVGRAVPLTVYALRKDGFAGDIALSLKDAPGGFKLSSNILSATQAVARLTLTVQSMLDAVPQGLNLEGRATIQGREVVHPALPAEDMMQAFEYRHLVPAKELKFALTGNYKIAAAPAKITSRMPVKIPVGGIATVQIAAPAFAFSNAVHFELRNPPKGITVRRVSPSSEGAAIVLEGDADKVKAGQRGKLVIIASSEKTVPPGKPAERANQRPLPTLPAIPFEITRN